MEKGLTTTKVVAIKKSLNHTVMVNANEKTGVPHMIERFDLLRTACATLGKVYQPANTNLQLENLENMLLTVREAYKLYLEKQEAHRVATREREALYNTFQAVSRRVVSNLASINAKSDVLKQTRSLRRRMTGRKKTGKVNTTEAVPGSGPVMPITPDGKKFSRRYSSYVDQVKVMKEMNTVLASYKDYAPNEEGMKLERLKALEADMERSTQAIFKTYMALTYQRSQRDALLYTPESGLVWVARAVKSYIASLEHQDNTCRTIQKLRFVNGQKKQK